MSFWDGEDDRGRDATSAGGGLPAKPRRERPGGLLVVALLGGLVLLGGAGWAAAFYGAEDRVPRGTLVAGVAVGGLTPEAARVRLEDGLRERAEQSTRLVVGDEEVEVTPQEAGLSVDYAASVAAAGGSRSWDPRRLWDYYTGGDERDPVVEVDEAAIGRAVARVAEETDRPARDGAVRLTRDGPVEKAAANGITIDAAQARDVLVATYLDEDPTAELGIVPVVPDVDDTDVRTAVEEVADPALSAPVTLRLGEAEVSLPPARVARVLALEAQDGALAPVVDERRLERIVDSRASGEGGEPVDASVRIVDGEPQIVPARPGVDYEPADLAQALLSAITRPEGRRSVPVEAVVRPAELTTQEVRALGVREEVSEFTTFYPDADYRNINIGRAAELVDGTLLEPGETFSMNDIVGERTRANGFTEGFVISDGILREDLGGGVSQLATTLFNAAFFAGLEDVEHKPHSFYIDRYPVGREATVAFGAIDLRFRNDTDYGVLVDAKVTPSTPSSEGVVTVRLYSTKVWDVESRTSERYDYTQPETRTLSTPDCYAYTGSSGFTVDVFRDFRRPGQSSVVRTQRFNTVYTPSDGVECAPPAGPGGGG